MLFIITVGRDMFVLASLMAYAVVHSNGTFSKNTCIDVDVFLSDLVKALFLMSAVASVYSSKLAFECVLGRANLSLAASMLMLVTINLLTFLKFLQEMVSMVDESQVHLLGGSQGHMLGESLMRMSETSVINTTTLGLYYEDVQALFVKRQW